MNTSLNGQYTCFIDHQPIVSYSLETDRGRNIFVSLNFAFPVELDAFVYGDISSVTTLSRRKY